MIRVVFMLMMALFATSCSAPVVKGTLFHSAIIPGAAAPSLTLLKGEMVVVLSAESTSQDESWPASCVRDALSTGETNIGIMPTMEFRDVMFPWFESEDIGQSIAELETMPAIKRSVENFGVRYIISVGGSTTTSSMKEGGWALVAKAPPSMSVNTA